jgi:hypothetical protein
MSSVERAMMAVALLWLAVLAATQLQQWFTAGGPD